MEQVRSKEALRVVETWEKVEQVLKKRGRKKIW